MRAMSKKGKKAQAKPGEERTCQARLSSLGYEWMALSVVLVMSVSAVLATANIGEFLFHALR